MFNQIYLSLKIILQLVILLIALVGFRMYYFLRDRRSLLLSSSFLVLLVSNLYSVIYPSLNFVVFVKGVNLADFILRFLFVLFVFLLILSLLNPNSFLEWGLLIYVLAFSLFTSFMHVTLYYVSIFLILLIISIFLLINYCKQPELSSLFVFFGMFFLSFSFVMNYYGSIFGQISEICAMLSFLMYVITLYFTHKHKRIKKIRNSEK